MSFNGEVVQLISDIVRMQARLVKLQAKIDNAVEVLKSKGVVL